MIPEVQTGTRQLLPLSFSIFKWGIEKHEGRRIGVNCQFKPIGFVEVDLHVVGEGSRLSLPASLGYRVRGVGQFDFVSWGRQLRAVSGQ